MDKLQYLFKNIAIEHLLTTWQTAYKESSLFWSTLLPAAIKVMPKSTSLTKNYFIRLIYLYSWRLRRSKLLLLVSVFCSWQGQAEESQELIHTNPQFIYRSASARNKTTRADTIQKKVWEPKWTYPAIEEMLGHQSSEIWSVGYCDPALGVRGKVNSEFWMHI